MAVHSNHPLTIRRDFCWVCESRFIETGGSANREIHHIIPVAYGGVNGPTVDLCDTHHSCLHKLALAVRAGKPYYHIFGTDDEGMRKKLMWLASQVNSAQAATLGDPNKKLEVTIPLDNRRREQIDRLKKVYPKLKSRQAVFLYALEELHNRNFLK